MSDLAALQAFAASHDFDLTAPLTHAQVTRVAEYWLPEMRFHWDERFHPVTLKDVFTMVEAGFAALPSAAQDEWRVPKLVRSGSAGVIQSFEPPVVHVPDGVVAVNSPHGTQFLNAVRVLGQGPGAREALRMPEVNEDAVVTHGASFRRANQFFGPLVTLSGNNTGAAGDPFLPRATEPDPARPGESRPRVTVMAALLNLFELLKYELIVAEADAADDFDYPPDALRGGFDIAGSLLRPELPQAAPLPASAQRKYLLDVIAAHETGGDIPDPPFGWRLDRLAWDAVTRFSFLEFMFFYAYNDFERYQTALFDNEHEGDDEGCCLIFDRNALNLAAASGDPEALFRVVPHSIVTSVHEEFQDADLFKFVPSPLPSPDPDRRARDVVEFKVYVAGGSHATYLTPGEHDLVDFQDTWGFVEENAPILLVLAPVILAISIILAIIEHFVDTEDFTSDDGAHAGPDGVLGDDPLKVATNVLALPMSADDHIYRPGNEELLLLRAFAGKWGGHDGPVDKSPPFAPKTARYFRKLLDKL